MKKRIIVCGYPKSGSTWVTRLTAEIVGCPVVGFWCEPFNKEVAIEGCERQSDYQCFKAHHSLDQLKHTLKYYGNGDEKIIYVIRDPRDIIVSATYYFCIKPRLARTHQLFSLLPMGSRVYRTLFHAKKYQLDTMTSGLINGTEEGHWLGVPWQEHVTAYLKSGTLVIKYEDLKMNPVRKARELCAYLGINRSDEELLESINKQSFAEKKKMFIASNQIEKAKFLRKGTSGEWEKVLSVRNIKMLDEKMGPLLADLGYQCCQAGAVDYSISRCN